MVTTLFLCFYDDNILYTKCIMGDFLYHCKFLTLTRKCLWLSWHMDAIACWGFDKLKNGEDKATS